MNFGRISAALLLFAFSLTSRAEGDPTFSVRFGVIAVAPVSKEKIVKETDAIPFKDCKSGEAFGYAITHKEGRRFSTHAVFYPPSPVKKVDEGLWGKAETSPVTGLTSNSESYTGKGISEHCFTESDPPGEWKVVVFINATRFATFNFRTVK